MYVCTVVVLHCTCCIYNYIYIPEGINIYTYMYLFLFYTSCVRAHSCTEGIQISKTFFIKYIINIYLY